MVDCDCAISLSMMKGVAGVRTNLRYPAQRLIYADGAMPIAPYIFHYLSASNNTPQETFHIACDQGPISTPQHSPNISSSKKET